MLQKIPRVYRFAPNPYFSICNLNYFPVKWVLHEYVNKDLESKEWEGVLKI